MKNIIWPLLILLIFVRCFTSRPVFKDGDTVRITTTFYSDPIIYSTSQYAKIVGLKVYLPKTPEISYGDKLVIEGVVEKGKLENPKIISVSGGGTLPVFRNKIIAFYQNVLPQPEGGLLAGITLGSKGAMSRDFYDKTKLTGVAHVVVASGTNVTFVVSFLMGILAVYMSRKIMIPFAILGIILYLFVSGFDAPLIRAAIMSAAAFLAQTTGRFAPTWRIFFLTAAAMLIYNPFWITDIGFVLSFASTAALLLFERRVQAKLSKVPEFLRESLSTSLSAQIGVAPILIVAFGRFNIWSPLVNALVLWTVPMLMIIGTIGGIMGLILPGVGKIILWLGYPMMWWFVRIVEIFS